MRNLTLFFTFTLLIVFSADAKKLGDVPIELLEATAHKLDSSAHASYYKKNVKVFYNFNKPRRFTLDSEYHYIIKVYDEEGLTYADFEIPCYRENSMKEEVSGIKAVAVNLVNGKVVKTKLSKKDIFKEKTSDKWTTVKFAIPNVKAGTVIEVKYTFSTPYVRVIPKWYFQNYIPTDQSIYSIDVPSYFTLTPVPTGAVPLQMDKKAKNGSRHGEVNYKIVGNNVPAIKEDKYVLNENDYRSGIKYEIMSTQFPNSTIEYYSKDWPEIAKGLLEAKYYGKQLNKNFKELKPIIMEAQKLPAEQQVQFLYDHVRTNYAWNDNYGLGSYEGLKDVFKTKSGSVGDLNLLLLNLLRQCDIPSYGLAMSARSRGLLNTNFPSLSSLNYLIVYVPQGTEYKLLDASSKWSPMGQLPIRATNINGLLIDEVDSRVLELDYDNRFLIQTVSEYTLDLENNKLIGSSQRKRSHYAATNYRIDLEEKTDENNQESENNDAEGQDDDIESYDLENTYKVTEAKNIDNIYEPIGLKYTEELNTVMKQVGEKIFLNATLDFGVKKNPFEEDTRQHPIFYNYKIQSQSVASIEIPEGYYVESTPKDVRVTLPNKRGSFHYSVSVKGKKLGINYKFKIDETMIYPDDYAALKGIYRILTDTHNEKIILSKGEKPKDVSTLNQK